MKKTLILLGLIVIIKAIDCQANGQLIQSESSTLLDDKVVILRFIDGYFNAQNYYAVISNFTDSDDLNPCISGLIAYAGDLDGDGIDELLVTHDSRIEKVYDGGNYNTIYQCDPPVDPSVLICDNQSWEHAGQVYIYKNDGQLFYKWKTISPGMFSYRWPIDSNNSNCRYTLTSLDIAVGNFDGEAGDEIVVTSKYDKSYLYFNGSSYVLPYYAHQARVYKYNKSLNGFEKVQEFNDLFSGNQHGMRCAAVDINGDGDDELVCTPAHGEDRIAVLDWDGSNGFKIEINEWLAFKVDEYTNYSDGIFVWGGDFDDDIKDELILAPRSTNDDVRIYKYVGNGHPDPQNLWPFVVFPTIAENPAYAAGVQAKAFNFDGEGGDELIISPNVDMISNPSQTRTAKLYSFSTGTMQFLQSNPVVYPSLGYYHHVSGGAFDGTKLTRPTVNLTNPQSLFIQNIHPLFEGTVSDPLHDIQKVEYQITDVASQPDDSNWNRMFPCDQSFAGKRGAISISVSMLTQGDYKIHLRAQNTQGRYSVPRNFTFTIKSWSLPSNSQPLSIHYDLLQLPIANDAKYGDASPESNLNLLANTVNGWVPYPLLTIDKTDKFINTLVDRYDIDYSLVYRAPACLVPNNE